ELHLREQAGERGRESMQFVLPQARLPYAAASAPLGIESELLTVASAYSGAAPFGRTGSGLAQRGSTASLVPRALKLPRRAPPPLWETSRAATQTAFGSANEEALNFPVTIYRLFPVR